MPLDELLALYGYEASDPISERESEGSDTTANLPDMTLDKVSGLGPGFREDRCDSPPPPQQSELTVRVATGWGWRRGGAETGRRDAARFSWARHSGS